MKSHPYASKRRLTNICCLVAGLGLAKIIIASYLLSNGEFFATTEVKLDPRQAYLVQESKKQKVQNIVATNTNPKNNLQGELDNTPMVSNQGVSLLPKSQNTDNGHVVPQENNPTGYTMAKNQNTQATMQRKPAQQEIPDQINTDSALVNATNITIKNRRDHMRASVLANVLSQNEKYSKKSVQELRTEPNLKQQYATQTPVNNEKQKKSALLSFVGTAHAEEYVRPDQNTEIFVPTPNVPQYRSPDSLGYKEAELNRKEEELLSLEQQMNSRMNELTKIEERLDTMVNDANQAEDTKFNHLIGTYINMKAKKAAVALTTLDEKIAVKILLGMKSKQSGEIFSYMDPVQAARLSEAMAKLRM